MLSEISCVQFIKISRRTVPLLCTVVIYLFNLEVFYLFTSRGVFFHCFNVLVVLARLHHVWPVKMKRRGVCFAPDAVLESVYNAV